MRKAGESLYLILVSQPGATAAEESVYAHGSDLSHEVIGIMVVVHAGLRNWKVEHHSIDEARSRSRRRYPYLSSLWVVEGIASGAKTWPRCVLPLRVEYTKEKRETQAGGNVIYRSEEELVGAQR